MLFLRRGNRTGTGKLYARKDGTVFYFCSSKCQGNLNLGRLPERSDGPKREGKPEEKQHSKVRHWSALM